MEVYTPIASHESLTQNVNNTNCYYCYYHLYSQIQSHVLQTPQTNTSSTSQQVQLILKDESTLVPNPNDFHAASMCVRESVCMHYLSESVDSGYNTGADNSDMPN